MNQKPFVIVVGLDYGELADGALLRAFELAAREATAEVHVISMLSPLDVDKPSVPKGTLLGAEIAAQRLHKHVASRLHDFLRATEGRPPKVPARVVSHVRFDLPANGIAQLASDLEADLVIVGTHGRQGLSRWMLGSVSEGVLRLAPCPVLVMRPKSQLAAGPAIEPPCPRCVEARVASQASVLWCEQHQERHGRRHTYHQGDRAGAETNFPLVSPSS